MRFFRTAATGVAILIFAPILAVADGQLKDDNFAIQFGSRGITSVTRVNDTYDTEYISPGGVLGNVRIRYRSSGDPTWKEAKEIALKEEADGTDANRNSVEYSIGTAENFQTLKADELFKLEDGALVWTLSLSNQTDQPMEIGDLALPLSMAEGTPQARGQIYTRKLIRHSLIAGNGSWVYWQRANAEGPFLVMVPQGKTKFEYSGRVTDPGAPPPAGPGRGGFGFTPFIHAAVSSVGPIGQGQAAGCEQPWRLPITSLKLGAKGAPDDSVSYRFKFVWAKDFDNVRNVLYQQGSIDVNIVPGMVLPIDLPG